MSHQCPRPECPRTVPDDLFACRGDWYALPRAIRDDIWRGYLDGQTADHAQAMADAIEWYREHPPKTPRATRTGGETGDRQ